MVAQKDMLARSGSQQPDALEVQWTTSLKAPALVKRGQVVPKTNPGAQIVGQALDLLLTRQER